MTRLGNSLLAWCRGIGMRGGQLFAWSITTIGLVASNLAKNSLRILLAMQLAFCLATCAMAALEVVRMTRALTGDLMTPRLRKIYLNQSMICESVTKISPRWLQLTRETSQQATRRAVSIFNLPSREAPVSKTLPPPTTTTPSRRTSCLRLEPITSRARWVARTNKWRELAATVTMRHKLATRAEGWPKTLSHSCSPLPLGIATQLRDLVAPSSQLAIHPAVSTWVSMSKVKGQFALSFVLPTRVLWTKK